MARLQSSSNTLRIPNSTLYSSMIHPNSTSNLDSRSSYPLLYSESPSRPYTSSAPQHAVASRPRRKNMREMIGTTTEDEFDALPLAVRRKNGESPPRQEPYFQPLLNGLGTRNAAVPQKAYFSTLERLRFAENSGSIQPNDQGVSARRRLSLADRRGLRHPLTVNPSRQSAANSPKKVRVRKQSRQLSVSSADVSWLLNLPDKLRRRQSIKEEQVAPSERRRDSVILDAADEAIYKASRRASRNLTPMIISPTIVSSRSSMDSIESNKRNSRPSSIRKAMIESFRWMDEEDNLDLRLVLDDYHANLDGVVLPTPSSTQRPSFRRHMSISKIPFGRSSLSSMNQSSPVKPVLQSPHTRQKSRAMSLMQPKHGASESISSIDPSATHYQDPEARLKLRVYLASPQKFDEAIEFGFPSIEGVSTIADKENRHPRKISGERKLCRLPLTEKTETFLDDDNISLSENDDASMLDPDSPLTPSEPSGIFKPQSVRSPFSSRGSRPSEDFSHLGIRKPIPHKHTESYAQSIAGSREMTLRMTLTRPDLRADENLLYGWQGVRNKSPLGEELLSGVDSSMTSKNDMKGPFGGADGWGPVEKDDGVVKRFWNRVRSSQRKSS